MGYHLKILTVPGHESPAAFQPVGPKTHTPLSPLQDRGHRFYNPEVGRWVSRDPIGEQGGENEYGFCENNSFTKYDINGLIWTVYESLDLFANNGQTTLNKGTVNFIIFPRRGDLFELKHITTDASAHSTFSFWNRAHEREHQDDFYKYYYLAVDSYADSVQGVYCTREKAECYETLVKEYYTEVASCYAHALTFDLRHVRAPYSIVNQRLDARRYRMLYAAAMASYREWYGAWIRKSVRCSQL